MIGGNELLVAGPSLVWPETQGAVVGQDNTTIVSGGANTGIQETRFGGRPHTVKSPGVQERHVSVEYRVNGDWHTLNARAPSAFPGAGEAPAHVSVFYSPTSPEWATLQRGGSLPGELWLVIAGLLLGTVGGGVGLDRLAERRLGR